VNRAAYLNCKLPDFSASWKDGLGFAALLHFYKPDEIDFQKLKEMDVRTRLEIIFDLGEELGVTTILDPDDLLVDRPDANSIITYVTAIYLRFKNDAPTEAKADAARREKELKQVIVVWMCAAVVDRLGTAIGG
jgi:hypothetical protein